MFALLIASSLVAASPQVSDASTRYEAAVHGAPRFEVAPQPVRSRRPFTVAGEFGYNGLAGLGLNLSYNFGPHWSLDTGAGLAFGGARVSARGRYNFLESFWTPFVGLGTSYLIATNMPLDSDETFTTNYDSRNRRIGHAREPNLRSHVESSPFGTATAGMSYQGPRGFAFMANLGWTQLLDRQSNIAVTHGRLTRDQMRTRDLLLGSGPVASLMFGYSF